MTNNNENLKEMSKKIDAGILSGEYYVGSMERYGIHWLEVKESKRPVNIIAYILIDDTPKGEGIRRHFIDLHNKRREIEEYTEKKEMIDEFTRALKERGFKIFSTEMEKSYAYINVDKGISFKMSWNSFVGNAVFGGSVDITVNGKSIWYDINRTDFSLLKLIESPDKMMENLKADKIAHQKALDKFWATLDLSDD